jgi:hypothetical protein
MKQSRIFVAGLALVALLLAAVGTAFASYPGFPVLTPSGPPSPTDESAIKAVIEQSFWLDGVAARTFDVSRFPSVYADDPSVQLSKEQSEFMARVRAANPGATIGSGFLDYKLAFYRHWQTGAAKLERVQESAQSQGRQVTAAELQSISEGGQPPPPRRTDPNYRVKLRFDSITVDGNRAEAVFDSGLVLERMYLLKTADGWRITGERLIDVHF